MEFSDWDIHYGFALYPVLPSIQGPTRNIEAISKMLNGSFDRLMTLSDIEGPISVRPGVLSEALEEFRPVVGILQILAPSLTSTHFSIFEMASIYPLI